MPKLRKLAPLLRVRDVRPIQRAPKRADSELLTAEHRAWRSKVLDRADYQCEWVEDGRRCSKRAPEHRLIADHIIERRDGGAALELANGQCLCVQHNTLKGIRARTARA